MLLVNDVASVGGGQTVMLEVARVLIAAGFHAHVASPPGHLAQQSEAIGAQWHEFAYAQRRLLSPRWRLPRAKAVAARITEGRSLAALAAEIGADVVHTGALVPHVDLVAAGRRIRARTVWHLNQIHPRYLFAGPLPDKIISISQAALRPASVRPGVARRSAVIPIGVDLERFRPPSADERTKARVALGLPADAFTVVTVARLEPLKGVDLLIRAASRARVKPVLVVIGDATGFSGGDAYARGLTDLAAELSVDVRFLGARNDVAQLLWAADLFAFATRWEAFGLVLAEASASGLAVVTTPTGGCREVIAEGETGLFVDIDDVAGFAAALDRLAAVPELRSRLGAAGRRRAVEAFDLAALGERLLPHYLELAAS